MSKSDAATFAKSPLNYTGGKHKLLPKLVPLMPQNADMTFVDLFGGGGNVVANAPENFSRLVYNELDPDVFSLVRMFASVPGADIALHVDGRVSEFGLSRDNKEGYLAFRKLYNRMDEKSPMDLFALVAHAFSNQIRFNRKGEFNLPFGKRTFNDKMRANLMEFSDALQSRSFLSTNASFLDFDFSAYPADSTFIYCDPPYLGSVATYNEHGGWTEEDEKALLGLLDELHREGYKWMLSNNFDYDNPILKKWAASNEDYLVVDLEHDYRSCNYHKNAARSLAAEQSKGADASAYKADDVDADGREPARPGSEVAVINYSCQR